MVDVKQVKAAIKKLNVLYIDIEEESVDATAKEVIEVVRPQASCSRKRQTVTLLDCSITQSVT